VKRITGRLAAAGSVALLAARPAQAHIVAARLGDFYAGALHPLTDLQDIVLWCALGLLAGSLGAARGRWLVLIFPAGLIAGLLAGATLGAGAASPLIGATLTILIGLLLATALSLPGPLLAAIAFVVAVVRGWVNAGGIGPETNLTLFAGGLGLAGYAVITLTAAATLAFRQPKRGPAAGWRAIAIRAGGSWIAAVGLMMGGFALATS
jgi:hydrogenase/urease accessory protein HupE